MESERFPQLAGSVFRGKERAGWRRDGIGGETGIFSALHLEGVHERGNGCRGEIETDRQISFGREIENTKK